jgi:hypothetical protein
MGLVASWREFVVPLKLAALVHSRTSRTEMLSRAPTPAIALDPSALITVVEDVAINEDVSVPTPACVLPDTIAAPRPVPHPTSRLPDVTPVQVEVMM